MTGRITKERKLRKSSELKADFDLLLTWLCTKNNGGRNIDFEKVAATMNCTVAAARSRYRRVKEHMEHVMDSMARDGKPGPASLSKPAKPAKPAKQDNQVNEEQAKPKKSYVGDM